ncbi:MULTISPECIES: PepSY-associated TM helix domain-containing protein [Rhodococcus]|uniref:Peptidase n=2 Tax=Rhodococcus TaxID=1827 RepID=A0A076EZ02_RHOOP|nr:MULTISPECIES: PepSY-associated TM helix domain-containing protein [Rhodococcus]AII11205.1 peptidase [Rhodococcus opacus]QSE87620.1 PepSY domain-containing protein [Rhodococcus pseudokoreensis]
MSVPELDRDADVARDEPSAARDPSPPRGLRPMILRLHFYAGVFVAPFLVVAAVSGGLYALAPSLEQLVYRDYLAVEPTGPALPITDQVRAAQQVRPDLELAAVRPAAQPGDTTRVLFTDPGLGESERRAVFIDPATAQSRGELVVYGSSGALPVRTWLSQLHRHLHLGEPGRIYSELAASWLWVIALGGVYLWVRRYRTHRQRDAAARLWALDRASRGRRRTLNWHGVVGIWIAVGLVFLSATGLTWSRYAGQNITDLRSALSWTTPELDTALGSSDPSAMASGGHNGHGGASMPPSPEQMAPVDMIVGEVDTVLEVAQASGINGAVEVSIPADASTAFTVTQTRQPWRFSTDSIAVDGVSGQVTDLSRFAQWPLVAKLSSWGIALHMGVLFGLLNQLVLAALAVALLTVIVRGYILWWRRRPTHEHRWGPPPKRGVLRGVHPAAAVAVVAGAIAIGWFIPLLGLSLIAFVLVDATIGARARLRSRREASGQRL